MLVTNELISRFTERKAYDGRAVSAPSFLIFRFYDHGRFPSNVMLDTKRFRPHQTVLGMSAPKPTISGKENESIGATRADQGPINRTTHRGKTRRADRMAQPFPQPLVPRLRREIDENARPLRFDSNETKMGGRLYRYRRQVSGGISVNVGEQSSGS